MRVARMRRFGWITWCAVLLAATVFVSVPALASEEENIAGSVKTVSGQACVIRGGERQAAVVGDHLYQGDTLETGSDSSMGVIFRDDTILSLGSGSRVVVDRFAFDPSADSMDFLVKVGKGTAQFISGQMAKIAPEKMVVETPLSTIGIRGTRFLVKVD